MSDVNVNTHLWQMLFPLSHGPLSLRHCSEINVVRWFYSRQGFRNRLGNGSCNRCLIWVCVFAVLVYKYIYIYIFWDRYWETPIEVDTENLKCSQQFLN